MGASFRRYLLPLFLLSIIASASAQICGSQNFANNRYTTCLDLPHLNSFLHWSFNQSTGALQVAFLRTGTSSTTWVAWAINPQGTDMAGSQALVAYQNSSGLVQFYTSPVSGYDTKLEAGDLSFDVSGLSAMYVNNEMTIFATLQLGTGATTVNHLWQEGPLNGDTPTRHSSDDANLGAKGTLNLLTGVGVAIADSRIKRRKVHGVLNAVSWGTLMPMGAIIARYLKVFKSADPAWFYLHVACQSSAYAVGVAGWATGLKLGSDTPGTEQPTHRNIGITLFILGTLQVFALFLRPNKDHKYRLFWNIYHHSIGYLVIILSIINIYKGFEILGSQKNWKRAYTGIIIVLGSIAVVLEAFTWFVTFKRKRADSDKLSYAAANGANGYSARSQRIA